MRKRGIVFVLFGLFLGIVLGFGLLALKRFGGQELMGLLESELKGSCLAGHKCDLLYDSVELSLVRLTAHARNVRVVEDGKTKLYFKDIEGDFSLSRIRQHQILLTELRLYNGFSDGVGPDSTTFRFIDYLAAPIPPERETPDRWKLKLQRLQLFPSNFSERFAKCELIGHGASLEVERTPTNDFSLVPRLEKLFLKMYPHDDLHQTEEIFIGGFEADLLILDELIKFNKIKLTRSSAEARLVATASSKERNRLHGILDYVTDARSLDLPTWIETKLFGHATLGGTLDQPRIEGTFENVADSVTRITRYPSLELLFPVLKAAFDFSLGSANTLQFSLSEFLAEGDTVTVHLGSPFTFQGDTVAGAFDVAADKLNIQGTQFSDLHARVNLSGVIDNPRIVTSGTVGGISSASTGGQVGPLAIEATQHGSELDLSIRGGEGFQGSLEAQAKILFEKKQDILREGSFSLLNYPLVSVQEVTPATPQVSVHGTVSGPLAYEKLSADASLEVSARKFFGEEPLSGFLMLKGGSLEGTLVNADKTISAELQKGSLTVALNDYPYLSQAAGASPRQVDCSRASLKLEYQTSSDTPEKGEGNLHLEKLGLGCEPYRIGLATPLTLPIRDGALFLSDINLGGETTSLVLSGKVSPFGESEAKLRGQIELQALLPLTPTLDDLSGIVLIESDLQGALANPNISGSLKIADARFDSEANNLSARNIAGQLTFQDSKLIMDSLQGEVNGGAVSIGGFVDLFNTKNSEIKTHLDAISLQPSDQLALLLSGDLEMHPSETGRVTLLGNVSIDNAELRQNVDLSEIIRGITDTVFAREESKLSIESSSDLPAVDLDLTISAPGNLLVSTNWAEAELMANLHVGGTLSEPRIAGQLETLSGWFGIKDRRFEITSGTLRIQPNAEPTVDLLSETTIRTREGDTVLVILEARGTLSAPKVSLSSDRGLTDREILNLITASSDLSPQARVSTLAQDVDLGVVPFISDDFIFGLGRFLKKITRIDSLSLEPTFNTQRGTVEPTVVAQKRLLDKLTLVGESSFGTTADSRVRLLYQLFPAVKLSGIADAESTRRNTALGVDLTYTILADQPQFLKVRVYGNHEFSEREILEGLRLNTSTRVRRDELSKTSERILAFYKARGFWDSGAEVTCRDDAPTPNDEYCHNLDIQVQEGNAIYISQLAFVGEPLAPEVKVESLTPKPGKEMASEEFAKELVASLTARLRSEGYISARIEANYERDAENATQTHCIVTVATGKPVTFIFTGNEKFKPADFLDSINLFKRKQPFGRNTVNLLLQNIDRLYRESGYLKARVSPSQHTDTESGRITYAIDIEEGARYTVSSVILTGNQLLSTGEIEKKIEDLSKQDYRALLNPTFAIEEQIENSAYLLKQVYIEEGFPQIEIEHSLEIDDAAKQVSIVYRITEGPSHKADWISIWGFPSEVHEPLEPDAPYSIPKANRYIDDLLDTLRNEGFFDAAISSELNPDSHQLTILVDAGQRTTVSEVHIEGNYIVSLETIRENLLLQEGAPWRTPLLEESRRKLLRLGLFSRVELEPEDGELDNPAEILLVRINERPLETLEVGSGLNSEYGVHLFGLATDREFFADGRSVSLRLDGYYDLTKSDVSQGIASFVFANPALLSSNYGLVNDLRFQRLDLPTQEFDLDRVSLATYLHRSWESNITASSGYTILNENLDNVSPDAVLSSLDTGNVRLGFISGVANFDRRDDPLNPHAGYNISVDYQLSSDAILSEANYFGSGGKASFIYPLPLANEVFSVALNGRVANAWTFAGTDYVPISQRYYLGGRNSVRGFEENSLGPRGKNGAVLGGDLLVAENFELRYHLLESVSLHTFLDAGTVYLKKRAVDLDDIRTSTGFGARYLSPIGPIGLEIGFPLDREEDEDSYRVHFSIGSNF